MESLVMIRLGTARVVLALLAVLLVLPEQAQAVINFSKSRFIYPASEKSLTIELKNGGVEDTLVQAWIDTGDVTASPSSVKAPFLITPPMFVMKGGTEKSMSLLFVGPSLPADRESLFWLNVLGISKEAGKTVGVEPARVKVAYRNRVKVLYRPDKLEGTLETAVNGLMWSAVKVDKKLVVRAKNSSPYNITVPQAILRVGEKEYTGPEVKVIPPFGVMDFEMSGLNSKPMEGGEVDCRWIDDFGIFRQQKFKLK
ncbi:fimbria/pilus periplasmic chaperone [Pseudomonas chlororaphis]|uniref:fimbrial biogenesis chaperone n=1 Tax=Pseudomonas chlororaphis TaxID=587753 RepID=UPI001B320A24|nr:fimbria/pilus periplasmic chaperone [Pseudomonas chlororaphis]MBP5078369.1 fimbria/pilus periplasmic chaperone [Pseudomonas chlororaphis]